MTGRLLGRRLTALVLSVLVGTAWADDAPPPEPDGYRTESLRAPTPATLAGARVLDLAGIEAAIAAGAVLIDVGPAPVRPENQREGSVWLPTHRSVPGAAWMPGAGLGDLPPEREQLLLDQAAALTGGDRAKPVIVFCKPDCWAGWNAGKRLVRAGYTGVAWFPAGIDAWQETHPTAPVDAMPGWLADPRASINDSIPTVFLAI